jgi:hypothetical protein
VTRRLSSPAPSGPAHRRGILTFLACLAAALALFAVLGGGYMLARVHEIDEELAPARWSAQAELLAAVLPTLQHLEVTYYERDQTCRAFSYRRGTFIDPHDNYCGEIETDMPFDDAATLDVGQLEAALTAAGIDPYRVIGSPSKDEFEFDTHAPSWCVLCPNVKYIHASSTGLPTYDLLDHYVAVDADWYVDIYSEGFPLGA